MESQEMILAYTKQKRTFFADASHTIAFADSDGNLRDYFVILRCHQMLDQLPMMLYMESSGIIHERLKKEGNRSVVYGLHTDIDTFYFYKMNSSGKIFASHTYYHLNERWNPVQHENLDVSYSKAPSRMRRWWDVKNKKWRSSWVLTDEIVTQIDNILENAEEDCYEIKEKPLDWTDKWLDPYDDRVKLYQ
ncbi:hypothetical protein BJY01DRAFT_150285 [Aspergillus pseudoustus]|uniref:Uncharacterized protein n=1 Tax=Aspergillus pseudoustus TaxID=1810923 RepID=A0ABR4IG20_9EURO